MLTRVTDFYNSILSRAEILSTGPWFCPHTVLELIELHTAGRATQKQQLLTIKCTHDCLTTNKQQILKCKRSIWQISYSYWQKSCLYPVEKEAHVTFGLEFRWRWLSRRDMMDRFRGVSFFLYYFCCPWCSFCVVYVVCDASARSVYRMPMSGLENTMNTGLIFVHTIFCPKGKCPPFPWLSPMLWQLAQNITNIHEDWADF